jgi:hypothetical protein
MRHKVRRLPVLRFTDAVLVSTVTFEVSSLVVVPGDIHCLFDATGRTPPNDKRATQGPGPHFVARRSSAASWFSKRSANSAGARFRLPPTHCGTQRADGIRRTPQVACASCVVIGRSTGS